MEGPCPGWAELCGCEVCAPGCCPDWPGCTPLWFCDGWVCVGWLGCMLGCCCGICGDWLPPEYCQANALTASSMMVNNMIAALSLFIGIWSPVGMCGQFCV